MMRLLLSILLCSLLLPACSPPGGASSVTSEAEENSVNNFADRLGSGPVSNQTIAALESVRKAPVARDCTKGVEATCPVHRRKMKIAEIPIITVENPEDVGAVTGLATNEFPFGAERMISPDNTLLPEAAIVARVYQCPNCMAYRKASDERCRLSAQVQQAE